MKLDIVTQDNLAIVRINETELTSSKSPELKTELLKLVSEGYVNILVNLGMVSYIDSSGLSALLFGRRQAIPSNGNLKLSCISGNIMDMIKIAQLDKVFDIFDTEEEAIESFLY
jgi:anti-anti-sigma factor